MKNDNARTTERLIEDFESYYFGTLLSMKEICNALCMTEDELLAIPEINEMMSK